MHWLTEFFQIGPLSQHIMTGWYDPYLVFLSYIIASLASYVALDMSAHLRKPTTLLFRISWLIGGAIIMGAGIWSMHFVGMLAFKMEMPMTYNVFWTGISMVVAIITAGLAFLFFTIQQPKLKHYVLSGIILGVAIPTMHYTGMAGMDGVTIRYLPIPFVLSVLIAITAAMVALWLSIMSDRGTFAVRVRWKLASGLIMGLAITGMHYTGMYAAVFIPIPMLEHTYSLDPTLLSISISTAVICITLMGLVVSTSKYILTSRAQKEKDFLEAILNQMRGGVIACDPDGNINLVNRTAENILGPEKSIQMTENLLYHPVDKKALKESEYPLSRALRGEVIRDVEMQAVDQSGNKHYLLINGQPLVGSEQQNLGAVVVFHDISTLKTAEEELRHNATHDVLTGLPNRTLLVDRIKQSIALANRNQLKSIIVFIDVDNFKFINDALGHSIGDALLRTLTNRLKSVLRPTDTLARLGGDEFVIVFPAQKDIFVVSNLLQRIIGIVAEPFIVEGHELRVTCSLGVSVYPDNGIDAETLLKNADAAMYQAKEAGRNNFQFFMGDMHTQVKKRLDMENGLRKALVNNEFFLEYQPKIDLRNNKIVGYEALIRWRHPKLGVVYPQDFISIAEHTGLIISIGEWVLRTACAQNKAWQDAGLPALCVSVNLSARQCREKHLMRRIKEILNETQLQPQFLELELTESAAMADPARFMEMLSECRALGAKTSIDDFGTGYSSLDYLRKFPVDTLKIDKGFIEELEKESDKGLSIVKAIISLGHSLNLNVIAEGVETEKQLQHLRSEDCDEIQGYFLSKPLLPQGMAEFIRNYFKK